MKKHEKRLMAALLTLVMLVGMLPLQVFASEQPAPRAADATQTLTTSVDYDSAERATATVTYHKVGEAAPACNIVFLLDASIQGGAATAQFKNMVSANAGALVAGTNANMQVISYTQNVTNHGSATTSGELDNLVGQVSSAQQGTANAALGLQEATEAVGTVAGNGNPTVVFWVLGDDFGNTQGASVEDELKALSAQLNDDDALIAWQLADQPDDLIEKYATHYTTAEGKAEIAAYAEKDADIFRSGMLDSLERVLHDHYRDTSITLSLAENQTLAEKITSAEWKTTNGNTLPVVETEVAKDGQSVTVTFDKLCANLTGDLVLELKLNTSVNESQTVLAEATTDGLYTGFFDEATSENSLLFPAVSLDRSQYTITFNAGDDATGTAPEKITAMPGQYVTLPDEGTLTNSGSSFGGWNDAQGKHYSAGQIIAMPEENLTLTPAWGHVEVELELGQVNYAQSNGNQMANNVNYYRTGILNFNHVSINGATPFNGKVHSVQVKDQDIHYEKTPTESDSRYVTITNTEIEAEYARHVGATDDDRVVAYIQKCKCGEENSDKYDLIIAGPGGVVASTNMAEWMDTNGSLETVDLSALDTSHVTDMQKMFRYCTNLRSIKFGEKFDTSNVTNMYDMFSRCSSLESLDLTGFDTSNVTTMSSMFWECGSLKVLDLTSFDASKLTSMYRMFTNCDNLTEIKFSEKINSHALINVAEMFYGCKNLTILDLGGFDTSSVTNMSHMFRKCSSLEQLNFPDSFDTSSVKTMESMFQGCSALTSLDLSNFDTGKVTEMASMFSDCSSLTNLVLSESFNTSSVTTMAYMFNGCSSLKDLILPESFNTSAVTNMDRMFRGCQSLTSLTLPQAFDISKVTNMYAMFADSTKLETVDLSQANFNTSSVTTMQYLFSDDTALQKVNLDDQFYLQNVQNLSAIFSGCSNLETINGDLIFSATTDNQAQNLSSMFSGCGKLDGVNFVYVDAAGNEVEDPTTVSFPYVTTMASMFSGCQKLTSIDMGGWQMKDLTSTSSMFKNCSSLQTLDLSWTEIAALEAQLSVGAMFNNVSTSAALNVANEADGTLSTFMQAVVDAFKASVTNGTVYVDNVQIWPATTTGDEPIGDGPTMEPSGDPTQGTEPEGSHADPENGGEPGNTNDPSNDEPNNNEPSNDEENNNEPSNDEQNNNDPSNGEQNNDEPLNGEQNNNDPSNDDETNDVPSGDNVTPDGEGVVSTEPVEEPGTDAPEQDAAEPAAASTMALSRAADARTTGDYTVKDNIWTHNTRTRAGSQFQYIVRVKYVGDVGAQSGEIKVTFPIPEDVRVLTKDELNAIGEGTELVQIGSVEYSDADTGFKGGRVVDADYDKDANALTATIDGLFTGTEVEINIWCTNEEKDFPDGGGYVYWDGTATTQDSAAAATSNVYRLWDVRNADPEIPEAQDYTLTYKFTGQVPPDAKLPQGGTYKEGDQVTVAEKPTTAYKYYTFDGWSYTENGVQKEVTPGGTLTMPDENITLIGNWTRNDEQAPKVTVKYQYDDTAPKDAPQIADEIVAVGDTYNVKPNLPDTGYASFNGWVPSLSIGDANVAIADDDKDGIYTSADYRIPTSGTLSTAQFADAENVTITYTGSWTPYTGTIKFDANADGVEGSMTDMTGVTHDEDQNLPANRFTRDGYTFAGWSLSEDGPVVKSDGESAAGLITENGSTVTLYAQWQEKPAVVETIMVYPADIIIYMGGADGAAGTVNENGDIVGSDSLPEPGFRVTLPASLKGTDVTTLTFKEKNGTKTWKFVPYDGESSTVYKLVPQGEGQAATRVQFTKANGEVITSDNFTVGKEVNTSFEMGLYKGGVGEIVVKNGSQTYSVNSNFTGTLTVRGTTADVDYAALNATVAAGEPGLTAAANTTYTINNGDVQADKAGIALLFDAIINTTDNDRTAQLEDRADKALGGADADRQYEIRYLDLVDRNNGNAWVKASENVTVSWPLPAGTDADTDFTLLHFKDLHRDMESGVIEDNIETSEVEEVGCKVEGDHVVFEIGRGGFSPFALVWDEETDEPDTPDKPNVPTEPDTPEDLNTVDHFSYIVGYEDGTVMPQKQITRAEVATIFYRLLKEDVRDENTTDASDFSDVSSSDWYGTTVATLAEMNILKGYEDGTFRPNAPITRAEFAAIATRFFDETGAIYEPGTFTDVTGSEWFAGAIMDAVNLGLIGGYEDGTVRPNNNITRAEACAIVNRTVGRVPDADHLLPEDEMITWPDNPESAWFYADMQEATNGHEYEWITEDGNKVENWTDLLDKDWTDR